MLMNWIETNTVKISAPAAAWREAVHASGRLLVEAGFAEPRYIDAMLRTVEELGPYIVIAPGVALPHARPEDGALGTGFAAVVLAAPVEFGNPDNDPVHLVVAFCAPDKSAHIGSLSRLAKALGKNDFLQRARAAQSEAELVKILNETE